MNYETTNNLRIRPLFQEVLSSNVYIRNPKKTRLALWKLAFDAMVKGNEICVTDYKKTKYSPSWLGKVSVRASSEIDNLSNVVSLYTLSSIELIAENESIHILDNLHSSPLEDSLIINQENNGQTTTSSYDLLAGGKQLYVAKRHVNKLVQEFFDRQALDSII